ncbi:BatA domain-containing protein [soil metagenome]
MISFRNPSLLIGTAAAILPIIIYFITRDRISVMPFSTLRFFAGTSASLVRRKKWLETLLLALRALLCAMIAIAFARPFLQKKPDASGKLRADQAVVLAIDVSQSMARPGAWKHAVDKADEILDALPGGSVVSLIAFDQAARTEANWGDASQARSKLAALQPAAAGTDLVAALRKADESLAEVAADKKRVVLISDLQRVGVSSAASGWKLKPGVSLQVETIAPDSPSTVGIVGANLPQSVVNDKLPHPVTVRIANISAQPMKDISLELALQGQPVQSQKVTVPANQQITASFRPTFSDIGDHAGTITLKSDATTETLFLNINVLPQIKVAMIAPDDEVHSASGASFFLARAIAPAANSPFDLHLLPSSSASASDLQNASVLIVLDVATISPELKKAILDFHKRGGGILLLPGSKTQPAAFTSSFGEFAPCQLRRVLLASDTRKGGTKALITRVDLEHPIFEIFQKPHSGDFSAVAIDKYWEVTDSQLSRVPMRLDEGRPFMLEKVSPGGGSCVLIVSPPDPTWNNFPQRAIYLPLLHQTLRYLAIRGEHPTTYQVGDLLPLNGDNSLKDPAGQSHKGSPLVAAAPGLYTMTDASGKEIFTYAVNTPFAEADTTIIPADELRASMESPESDEATAGSGLVSAGLGSREFWTYLIAASLVLVIVELFVSNRVPRH